MAENDIYDNRKRYQALKDNITTYTKPPKPGDRRRKYVIKNHVNLKYFNAIISKLEVRDASYIRRLRVCRALLVITHIIEKDLVTIDREDIDQVMTFSYTVNKSIESRKSFSMDIKFIWKQLFPEKDERGRFDETLTPYVVRHLSNKVDKSREKLRGDKFSMTEFEQIVQSFANDPRMQALLTISLESLSRSQELLYRKIKDVEIGDSYAKIYITSHGKEGTGFLRVIDSYFYLSKWLNQHPLRNDSNAFLFVNLGKTNRFKQMKPRNVNKLIRERCRKLGILKPITFYSLKRNGVTIMRLAGESDLEIQRTARWTSSKQLKTYDLSNQEESFMQTLIKRGKIQAEGKYATLAPKTKECAFCHTESGFAETMCSTCKRPLDRLKIIEQEKKKDEQIVEMSKKILDQEQKKDLAMEAMGKKMEAMETMFLKTLAELNPETAVKRLPPEMVSKIQKVSS